MLRMIKKQEVSNCKDIIDNTPEIIKEGDQWKILCNRVNRILEDKYSKIQNIGIVGPYGSGKSSIIQTIMHDNKVNTFLKISLLNLGTNFRNRQVDNEKLVIELENRIINQILFKKDQNKNILGAIKNFIYQKRINIWFMKILFSIFLMQQFLIYSNSIKGMSICGVEFSHMLNTMNPIMICTLLTVITFVIIEQLYNKKFSRIKLSGLEVDFIGEKSPINKNLDAIINSFYKNRYDTVIIEDLERYCNKEIFLILRELNNTLNESNINARPIRFIYVINEEIFETEERIKFFDYILSVIPFFNEYNKDGLFKALLKSAGFEIKQRDLLKLLLLEELIGDSRSMKSIVNDFINFSSVIRESVDSDVNSEGYNKKIIDFSLLTLAILKHKYNSDFLLAYSNRGGIVNTFKFKEKIKDYLLEEIYKKETALKIDYLNYKNAQNYNFCHTASQYLETLDSYVDNRLDFIIFDGKMYGINEVSNDRDTVIDIFSQDSIYISLDQDDKIREFTLSSFNSKNYQEFFTLVRAARINCQDFEVLHLKYIAKKKVINESSFSALLKILHDFPKDLEPLTKLNKDLLNLIQNECIYENFLTLFSDRVNIKIDCDTDNMSCNDRYFIDRLTSTQISPQTFNFYEKIDNAHLIALSIDSRYFKSNSVLNFNLLRFLDEQYTANFKLKQTQRSKFTQYNFDHIENLNLKNNCIEYFINLFIIFIDKLIQFPYFSTFLYEYFIYINKDLKNSSVFSVFMQRSKKIYFEDRYNFLPLEGELFVVLTLKYSSYPINTNWFNENYSFIYKYLPLLDLDDLPQYMISCKFKLCKSEYNILLEKIIRYGLYHPTPENLLIINDSIKNNKSIDIYELQDLFDVIQKYISKCLIDTSAISAVLSSTYSHKNVLDLINSNLLNIDNLKNYLLILKCPITDITDIVDPIITDFCFKNNLVQPTWNNIVVYFKMFPINYKMIISFIKNNSEGLNKDKLNINYIDFLILKLSSLRLLDSSKY